MSKKAVPNPIGMMLIADKLVRKFKHDPTLVSTERSAGFVLDPGQAEDHRTGFQVFVRVCRYSDELLENAK